MNEDIQKQLASILSRLDALEVRTEKIEADTIHYIESHSDEHLFLQKMVISSYHKTHPEYTASLQQIHDIVNKKSKGSGDKST